MAAPSADVPNTPPGLVERLWEGEHGPTGQLLSGLLAPAELAFRGIVAVRDRCYRLGLFRVHAAPAPAISVGNLTVGGTGKTPVVRWVVDRLVERGRAPGILHGGYSDDEPALHRQWFPHLPVAVDRDRVRGARRAVEAGADVLVLDDAFQHRRIRRDLDVVLVAAEQWTDRPRLLPRGPYREPLAALGRADLVVVTRRSDDANARRVAERAREYTAAPIAVAHLAPGGWLDGAGNRRDGRPDRAVAVAGVGRPRAFFEQVESQGVELAARLAFRDHHEYEPRDAEAIVAAGGGVVVTTAKDAVKLGPLLPDTELWVLDQQVVVEEGRDVMVAAVERMIR